MKFGGVERTDESVCVKPNFFNRFGRTKKTPESEFCVAFGRASVSGQHFPSCAPVLVLNKFN